MCLLNIFKIMLLIFIGNINRKLSEVFIILNEIILFVMLLIKV